MSRGIKGLTVVLAAFGVPAGVGTVAKDAVAADPLAAVLVLVIYWLVLGMVGLVSTVARGPVQRRAGQLGDAIDAGLGRKFSRYTRHYRQHMLTANRWVDFKGLSIVGDHTPELDAVFVDVAVERRPVDQVPSGLVTGGAADESLEAGRGVDDGARQSIHNFLGGERAGVLAVIGGPGCGKTTLMRHLARNAARRKSRRRRVPVFLALSRLSSAIGDEPGLPQLLRIKPPELRVPEPRGWWEQQLHDGNCLVLMDGLDEVADGEDRRRVADWIGKQVNAFPGNDFVITSRPGGYRQSPIQGAKVLAVQPFSREQIERFLRGWYLATEREATGADDSGVDAIAADKANDLIDRLADAPGLDELTANPLLLTMIALVHRYRSALPRGRADLYEEICRAMLWSRHEARGVTVKLSGEAKWEVLAQLAYTLMRSHQRNIDKSRVAPMIEGALEASLPGIECEQFLREVCGNGLLVEIERDWFAFAHQTIGEYLAAKHIIDCGLEDELSGYVDNPWWGETLELYAACSRSLDTLVETCLRKGTEGAMAQAFTFANYGGRLDRRLRDRLRRLEEQAFEARADRSVRRAVSRAAVSRHFGTLKRLGDSGFYCPEPVTEDLYWLFRSDNADGVVAQWAPHGDRPVTGLWPEDVKRFIDWVNVENRYSDRTDSPFRLPNRAEAELIRGGGGLAVGGVALPVWRSSARGAELPYTVTKSELVEVVAADLSSVGLLTPAQVALLRHSGEPVEESSMRFTNALGQVDLVAAYRKHLPSELYWLPMDAAVFTAGDSRSATANLLIRGSAEEQRLEMAELVVARAGVSERGLRVALGHTAEARPDPDVAARESVAAPGRWRETVSRDLAEKARRVLSRQEPLRSAAVLRLTGLIAAAEFEAERNQLNRDACLNVVALATFLERRAGARYRGEALILVRD